MSNALGSLQGRLGSRTPTRLQSQVFLPSLRSSRPSCRLMASSAVQDSRHEISICCFFSTITLPGDQQNQESNQAVLEILWSAKLEIRGDSSRLSLKPDTPNVEYTFSLLTNSHSNW